MGRAGDWCILTTSSGRTLPLARSLADAGFEVWTPARTVKRPAPGNRRRYVLGQRRIMVEVTLPILPGFVFARLSDLDDLYRASSLPYGPHPAFSIMSLAGRVPAVGDRQVAGLRGAEAEALASIVAEREAETRMEARRLRAEMLTTERARRKALRQERKDLVQGEQVTVEDVPMMAGMIGTVVRGRGTSAVIHFGGSLTMEVEAWRVHPVRVQSGNTLKRDAA